jgi:hypothetical protein
MVSEEVYEREMPTLSLRHLALKFPFFTGLTLGGLFLTRSLMRGNRWDLLPLALVVFTADYLSDQIVFKLRGK